MKIFDSHAHYFDRRFFSEENPKGVDALLQEDVFGDCVCGVINVATNNENSIACIEQAAKFDRMYAAVGIHPEDVEYCKMNISEEINILCDRVDTKEKRQKNKIVAIGEIGLDYHMEKFDKGLQQKYFDAQMELAAELDVPVIIHDRDAHCDCFDTVCRYPSVKGVFHSYSGSAEMAIELIKRGWYISFSGVVSFKNAAKIKTVAACVPDDRILIETDAPYLAPHPYRGKINHSGRLFYTASALAEERGVDVRTISDITYRNARELFNID